ncbi:monofunctional biosynthetic peptidoglycan transglycosylase [Falsirhodobacter sp. alg1]|uniref:monofunctional biosynthetic peptidoglycan transglycosylase n=1 Tax=Falsirhodobacter sp. alg1 TaxID=1472418 RepID=UPI0009E93499|nr:monofunctional biosynthetic peptidoglycan transglycosylase [Falsirhodobacter sp. alg1]
MATSKRSKSKPAPRKGPFRAATAWLRRGGLKRISLLVLAGVLAFVLLFRFVAPPTTPYILAESRRLGGVDRTWVSMDRIAPVMARSAVAAEDANFCRHWGFDMAAIRSAIGAGSSRGASTISQQVVKNVYLWQGRSWPRKALEAILTPMIELTWSKRRILEIYLNVAEFDEGVFGVEAAARHYFRVSAADLSATQAARLAAVLPNPKGRDAAHPTPFVQQRANAAQSGAATIRADGRDACFRG